MPIEWKRVQEYSDIIYEHDAAGEGIAKITINRPEKRNAFRPETVEQLIDAFSHARDDESVGVILFTGAGDKAFCSGGDQSVRGDGGYVGKDKVPRLNVLDLQRLIRILPKPVVAMVAGYAIGGGHVLHVVCDLTIAAENAIFGQTGPKVGSFDGGYGSNLLARMVGADFGNGVLFAILAASASYIAVPAAMRISMPKADAGVYLTLSLGVTFPFNLVIGIPMYLIVATGKWS